MMRWLPGIAGKFGPALARCAALTVVAAMLPPAALNAQNAKLSDDSGAFATGHCM